MTPPPSMTPNEMKDAQDIARLRHLRSMVRETIDQTAGMKCGFLVYLLSMAEAEIAGMIERSTRVQQK